MRIFLTGFMGAGKTTVGRHLAALLGVPFVDLDHEVERRAGASVRQIFERSGEPEFRRLEHETLRALCEGPALVAATGGGTITFEINRELMGRAGMSVWLHPPFAVIVQRIGGSGKLDRPLFRDETQAWELYRQRLSAYERADVKVDVGAAEEPAQVAARIALMVPKGKPCAI